MWQVVIINFFNEAYQKNKYGMSVHLNKVICCNNIRTNEMMQYFTIMIKFK